MNRISTYLPSDNMAYHTRNREVAMTRVQNQIGSQSRIQNLRDDPAAAAHSTRYQSYLTRLDRFARNITYSLDNHRVTEGHLSTSVDIMQRIREIAVQGANGTYQSSDLQNMAVEVNQLLEQLVQNANAVNGDGTTVFSGDRTQTIPFRSYRGHLAGMDESVITQVDYIGTNAKRLTEVSDGTYMALNLPGNEAFWAENQSLFAATDATGFVVGDPSTIRIDGNEIVLTPGDTVHDLISKVNSAGLALTARLDPISNGLALETTSPHQIWVEDVDGSVLSDLGLVATVGGRPPMNLHADATVFGGSLFDTVIALRDSLAAGNTFEVGGRGMLAVDSGLNHLLTQLGELGAQTTRLEFTADRIAKEIPDTILRNSHEVDLDLTEAVVRLKALETTHQAALSVTARILQTSLLDFLR